MKTMKKGDIFYSTIEFGYPSKFEKVKEELLNSLNVQFIKIAKVNKKSFRIEDCEELFYELPKGYKSTKPSKEECIVFLRNKIVREGHFYRTTILKITNLLTLKERKIIFDSVLLIKKKKLENEMKGRLERFEKRIVLNVDRRGYEEGFIDVRDKK